MIKRHQMIQNLSLHVTTLDAKLSQRLMSDYLFVVFRPTKKNTSFGDVAIADEDLQILSYARHLWPFSSEGSLACHTYCDTATRTHL